MTRLIFENFKPSEISILHLFIRIKKLIIKSIRIEEKVKESLNDQFELIIEYAKKLKLKINPFDDKGQKVKFKKHTSNKFGLSKTVISILKNGM